MSYDQSETEEIVMQDDNPRNRDNSFSEDNNPKSSREEQMIIDVAYTGEESSLPKGEQVEEEAVIPSFYEEDKRAECIRQSSYYHETIKTKQSKRSKHSFSKFIAGLLIISIVGGASIGTGFAVANPLVEKFIGGGAPEEEKSIEATDIAYIPSYVAPLTTNNSIADIAENVGPSVVSIKNNKTVATWAGEFNQSGLGSGVIFDEDEEKIYIISNAHVVEGASTLTVTFLGNEKSSAMLIGTDTITDIAVIAVNKADIPEEARGQIRPAPIGNSSDIRVGDLAIAIGNPINEAYNNTVTVGVISALNREINLTDQKLNLIQTDAAINPGNSGGALVGPSGEVIGINTIKLVDGTIEGMGFALPMNDVMPIVGELMEKGRIVRPSLGIKGQDLTEELGNFYEIPVGILIVQVVPGSSADMGGIKPGDIILEFDDQKITTMNELKQILLAKKVDDLINVKLIRGASKHTIQVKLQEMPNAYSTNK
ncbi:MAG: trypsin-like peptidase domain-containing protein [Cellulosilyticaceae bacterium]